MFNNKRNKNKVLKIKKCNLTYKDAKKNNINFIRKNYKKNEKILNATANAEKNKKTSTLKVWMVILPTSIIIVFLVTSVIVYREFKSGNLMLFGHSFTASEVSQTSQNTSDIYIEDSESIEIDDIEKRLLTVVNINNPIDEDYEPQLSYFNDIPVSSDAIDALKKMFKAAENDGVKLTLSKGYVTADEQQKYYQNTLKYYMDEFGYSIVKAESNTKKIVPTGETSEHRTGLLFTFSDEKAENFSESESYGWLIRNSVNYGFILRYTKSKESTTRMEASDSQFRYVGVENAKKMTGLAMCLEEYITYLAKQ